MRLDLTLTSDGDPVVEVDGVRAPARSVRWLDSIDRAHPLVWVSRQRQYDLELYLVGELVGRVPGATPELDAEYDAAEELRSA